MTQTCFGCPSTWDIKFSDNTEGYIRYRWGYLSLGKQEGRGFQNTELEGEQLGDYLSGVIDVNTVVTWLSTKSIIVK